MGDVTQRTQRTSISLPKDLLEKGQQIARKRRRNFSNYVADLIASDSIDRPVGSDSILPSAKKTGNTDGAVQRGPRGDEKPRK